MNELIIELNKKIETLELMIASNLREKAYGQLYEDAAVTTITITTAGTYYGWISATAGLYNLVTLDTAHATADRITIGPKSAGIYIISQSVCFSSGTAARTIHSAVHKNGAAQAAISAESKLPNANEMRGHSAIGILALASGDYLDLRFTADVNGTVINLNHAQLTAYRIK